MKPLNYVVITGVSRGLGKALAKQFLEASIKVVGCARNVSDMEDDENLHLCALDVTCLDDVRRWATDTVAAHGIPDMVIQSAGTINTPNNIELLEIEEIRNVLEVNLMGVINGMRGFLPDMKVAGHGMIVNISSGWGRAGKEGLAPYCASKYAIEGLTDSVSRELPDGVSVYVLDPGDGIQTDMLSTCLPDYYPEAPSADAWAAVAYRYLRVMWDTPPMAVSLTVDLSELDSEVTGACGDAV